MEPLWADLINSDWRDYRGSGRREDRLDNDSWLAEFLARCGWESGRLPGRQERRRLRTLRATLRRMVDAVRERRVVARADLAAVNRLLAAAPWVRQLEWRRGSWHTTTAFSCRGMARVLAEVARSFASLLSEADPTRIKTCANPDCGWVMYDASRNRTRRWCEARECGNLMKVRRFRRRQRAALARDAASRARG